MSTISFKLKPDPSSSTTATAGRLGTLLVTRPDGAQLDIETPNFLASTSRGAVPHLSRDHVLASSSTRGLHVTYDSFLEQSPPLPPLYPSERPMHDFLAYPASKHILSLSLRDTDDTRTAPTNGNDFVNVWTARGVRRTVPKPFHDDVVKCHVDILEAISDIPTTAPPYSQRRLEKSVERTSGWLADLLRRHRPEERLTPGILANMVGGTSVQARKAFAVALQETVGGRKLVDDLLGVSFDLAHLRTVLDAARPTIVVEEDVIEEVQTADAVVLVEEHTVIQATVDLVEAAAKEDAADGSPTTLIASSSTRHPDTPTRHPLVPYLDASLHSIPPSKLRVARSTRSPHDVLLLVRDAGIDLFDARWAQDAASVGVALTFVFPAAADLPPSSDVGINLYDAVYAYDHQPLTSLPCDCISCTPLPQSSIPHTTSSPSDALPRTEPDASYRRSYIHHLLRTHEMSAHALLAAHNLSVLERFFASIRHHLLSGSSEFGEEVERFVKTYDGSMKLLEQARLDWKDVDLARGKGRLAREKVKMAEAEG
ncbi:tRNA-guanine transglycosylase [Exidia glandulosa HHB12029]|uniref:tRNA-guanine transglycosylase n=1 Tax=Exidia glandulosa HHB12029 TaxID=1314781 RepID=A0A165DDE6_EXIGL|nr:tRNA-guanine transglycosylase [Exidia glandulosa HHB12029]